MTKLRIRLAAGRRALVATAVLAAALTPFAASASGTEAMASAQIDLTDKASLQRGAALFMNYCSGCHSLNYQRYSRTAEDLGLSQAEMEQNLIFCDAKYRREHRHRR